MIHYHGTPISPIRVLLELAGRHFCVSHMRPDDVTRVHQIGQSVMLDNGAFSKWKSGKATDWQSYYAWADRWLDFPTTWAVIPDEIDAPEERQNQLLREWPHGDRGAPVWHMNEGLMRLLDLCQTWPKVCIGSTQQYAIVKSDPWCRRMDEAFNAIARSYGRMPWLHMLRGMQCAGDRWPFASADSTDIALSHHRAHNSARKLADRWDAAQTPAKWVPRAEQLEIAGSSERTAASERAVIAESTVVGERAVNRESTEVAE